MKNNFSKIPECKDENSLIDQFLSFVEIVIILREKCPWDNRQTNESIAALIVEEAYEVLDAIHKKEDKEFAKELGDLFLHIVMHAVMADERGAFNLIEVLKLIKQKLIHRHPHVFGNTSVNGETEVVQNWENLKLKEGRTSMLQGVPKSLPSLLRAQRLQHKAAQVGFDWADRNGVWNKVEEELKEFREELENNNIKNAEEELGDLIFSIVNAARFEEIYAEEALQKTNDKFTKRFQYIEKVAKEKGISMKEMSLEEMDAIWDEAKKIY